MDSHQPTTQKRQRSEEIDQKSSGRDSRRARFGRRGGSRVTSGRILVRELLLLVRELILPLELLLLVRQFLFAVSEFVPKLL